MRCSPFPTPLPTPIVSLRLDPLSFCAKTETLSMLFPWWAGLLPTSPVSDLFFYFSAFPLILATALLSCWSGAAPRASSGGGCDHGHFACVACLDLAWCSTVCFGLGWLGLILLEVHRHFLGTIYLELMWNIFLEDVKRLAWPWLDLGLVGFGWLGLAGLTWLGLVWLDLS